MKTNLFLALLVSTLFCSCNLFTNYGKKVEFGDNEVYYKGDGVTEADAEKLGKYLKKQDYFTDGKTKSVQITNDGTDYVVHLVVDKSKITDPIKLTFWKFQYFMSQDVFGGKPARIAFSDDNLKDIEILPPVAKYEIGESFILYDNSEIKKSEAKALGDFFIDAKLFTETNGATALYTKDDKVSTVRLVVNPKTFKDEMLPEFSFWQEQMKEKLFEGKKAKMLLTSAELEDLNPLPKLTEEDRQAFLNRTNQPENNEQVNDFAIDSTVTQTSSGILRLPNK